MEYNLNMQDMLGLIKKNIKIVIIFVLVFAVLVGVYKFLNEKKSVANVDQSQVNKENSIYNEWSNFKNKTTGELNEELVKAYKVMDEHPLMALDASDCTTRHITFTLDEKVQTSRSETVQGWLFSLDSKSLFGTDSKVVRKYRNDILFVGGDFGEIIVRVYDIKAYDVDKVAKTVIKTIKSNAKKTNIRIIDINNNKINGFSQSLADRQDTLRYNVTRIQNEIATIKNNEMDQPAVITTGGINFKKVLLFAIIGMILGFVLAVLLILFRVIRRGTIVSCKQVEECFEIEKLGAVNDMQESDIKLTDAVVRAMSSGDGASMILGIEKEEKYVRLADRLNESGSAKYIFGTTKLESVDEIDEIKDVENIIIPITIGKTTNKDITKSIKWINKFKKKIMGFIILN